MNYKVVYSEQFIVWITAMLSSYEDSILAGMIKKGYTVGNVTSDGSISHPRENSPSVLITFKASSKKEGATAQDVHNDLLLVLKDTKALYYSAIVVTYIDGCFIGSNITLSTEKKPVEDLPVINT